MKPDPVTLKLISTSLLYASEEMGLALRNAAYSPNIKERMDHSAAIFDSNRRLLAQAEHIPVHLGSLPWGLQNLTRTCERLGMDFEEGSMVVANDPYVTGTHLNDVTVAAPIHHRGSLVAFAVNKAHHSDVGGKVPGSISPDARTLSEEGFVLDPSYLRRKGRFVGAAVGRFTAHSRTPTERKGDLRAQAAANATGARRVLDLLAKYGRESFDLASERAFSNSESLMRRRLSGLRSGSYEATDYIEAPDGSDLALKVKVTVSRTGVDVDYSGTHEQVDYPLNAVFGVTISGAYFVLRCLTGDDVPANHGAFAPIRVRAPRGSLLNPTYPHPVGGGNVETSQRNADVVFRALLKASPDRVPAASGGSMNNVMVGGSARGSPWAFYETIGVGLGGRNSTDGIDGIQCNMTNTMNTPIEELERSFPILMTRYEFRPDSSGAGQHRGGCGLVRSYRVLSDRTTFTVLADREKHFPWGVAGGKPGKGTEVMLRRAGVLRRVRTKCTMTLMAGDEVEIRTAGGGGYGSPRSRRRPDVIRDVRNGLVSSERALLDYGVRASNEER
ncbi:MAG: hydantoinase B/oxoprolinase family protein [Thaumarchaeota archaeon]|nr:hydantoinase B/oxoprolinase family protein [Nitrososphaerota archaeon]